ncbi:T9SS type A sorting domain-containing protein [bacterium]|nr:T9SS type A sorting domain-containing protein [bacterium]
MGKLISRHKDTAVLSTANLKQGLYFIKINNATSEEVVKFIKE